MIAIGCDHGGINLKPLLIDYLEKKGIEYVDFGCHDKTSVDYNEYALKVSNAVAYYMKSALDNTGSEYITLNPVKLGSSTSNDVLGTLAHEGYPGHLYAYVYSKELGLSNIATVMTSTAHGEGWALGRLAIFLNLGRGYLSIHIIIIL